MVSTDVAWHSRGGRYLRITLPLLILSTLVGCTRTHYRIAADRDAYRSIRYTTEGLPWQAPADFTVLPTPASRYFDPTPIEDPLLPPPQPQLYSYNLPPIIAAASSPDQNGASRSESHSGMSEVFVSLVQVGDDDLPEPPEDSGLSIEPQPLRPETWELIPESCLRRMLEFESIRKEYLRTYGVEPIRSTEEPRLRIRDIVELARLNNRPYFTARESLYRAALRVSLQRYQYQVKFAPFGNGVDVDYGHFRNGGIERNTLFVPSRAQLEVLTATGGEFVAQFANDVLLEFNGTNGFAADVGSELLFNLSQRVLQRDVVFEQLTLAERNVVYEARDLARFRKQLFVNLATRYYNLLNTYRQIEIDAQNYFTLVRTFEQGLAEAEVGRSARVQADQVEQNSLRGLITLINTCNRLEVNLDNLKLQIGIPTETPINIELSEMYALAQRDELTVSYELLRRIERRLQRLQEQSDADPIELLNVAEELLVRLTQTSELLRDEDAQRLNVRELRQIASRVRIDEVRVRAASDRAQWESSRMDPTAPTIRLFESALRSLDTYLELLRQQREFAESLADKSEVIREVDAQIAELKRRRDAIVERYDELVLELQFEQLPQVAQDTESLMHDADQASKALDQELGLAALPEDQQAINARVLEIVQSLLARAGEVLGNAEKGLVEIAVGADGAMQTALVSRLELMNSRGMLADEWRRIKIAGDNLRSIIDLNATQSIRTRSDVNRVFDFTFDDSTTQLSLSVDTPVNRRQQRNAFRESLINYQSERRDLVALEDSIKLAIRNDLRDLKLAREQYQLSVASAALAFERVSGTQLQLQLGVSNVSARDFLEAQTAYVASLSEIANQHIDHIIARMSLFLNTEAMQLDDNGFWHGLNDDELQPELQIVIAPYAGYGSLPRGVLYSRAIRRMLQTPRGPVVVPPTISDEMRLRQNDENMEHAQRQRPNDDPVKR